MREVTYYACELCGHIYSEKIRAEKCEKSHVAAKEIAHAMYRSYESDGSKYPLAVDIRMADGTVIRFYDTSRC